MNTHKLPDNDDIKKAKELINKYAHLTPILTSTFFDDYFNAKLYFKCENFQKSGSFKFRGATNAVLSLSKDQLKNGVITHSSGNFGQALALTAKMKGIKAYIVMPNNSPKAKVEATKAYGAEVILCEPTLEARESTANEVISKTNANFIHPYNDYTIIAGQASAMMEILDFKKDLDIVISPVGGGGLISGTILAAKYNAPKVKVFAAEPKNADDAYRSWISKSFIPSENPKTICDGLKTSLGSKTYPIIMENIDKIITASEENIIEMMRLVWERMKIVIEPSSAVTLAAMHENKELFEDKNIAVIFSGGNVDLKNLPWII
ncbi:MAG: pyridoxal-phosphate dependent enzyme [Bacteroidota bacterium]